METFQKRSGNRRIWLAGGCFWGMEALFARIPGVLKVTSGYANGKTEHPRYEELSQTGHAETVEVLYDIGRISLTALLCFFFRVIDPTAYHRQGNDVGAQYRSGIYYPDDRSFSEILRMVARVQARSRRRIVTEVAPLRGFYPAEACHQHYLEKHPDGYCHIDLSITRPEHGEWCRGDFRCPPDGELKSRLSAISYAVTRENATEPAFANPYWDNTDPGIYVDILSGEPFFSSSDQFASGCGWPSFTKPLPTAELLEFPDRSHGMERTEVRGKAADTHLGHAFHDGPKEAGGLRYCVNSAALRFIPCADMIRAGYASWLPFIR